MTELPNDLKGKSYLTTSQAAKLLSVSPDTVLKWVRAGKVKSRRTLGGHFRIPISELNIIASGVLAPSGSSRAIKPSVYQYCWEYLAAGGEIKAECIECITYRSRARRCYELKDLLGGVGCLNLLCDTECSECDYYKIVRDQGINVLVIGVGEELITDLNRTGEAGELEVRFTPREYEAAAIIQTFRPDYIVVDCAFGKGRTAAICSSLFSDIRIPVVRIILSSGTKGIQDYCDREVFGWIRKPFTVEQLKGCIRGVPELAEQHNV